MLGGAFLIGGLRHHEQHFNRVSARLQSGLLFLATVALLVPSMLAEEGSHTAILQPLSLGLSVLLIVAYCLGLVFSLGTHREVFASVGHGETGETHWPMPVALVRSCRSHRARRAGEPRVRGLGAAALPKRWA